MPAIHPLHRALRRLVLAGACLCIGVIGAHWFVAIGDGATIRSLPAPVLAPRYGPSTIIEGPFDDGPPGLTSAVLIARARDRERDMALVADRLQPAAGRERLLIIWIDRPGIDAFVRDEQPDLPVGTLVLNGRLGTGLTMALLKREAGYNPEAFDWEFMEFDHSDGEVLQRGRIRSCIGCHGQSARGGLFRRYLPRFADTPVPTRRSPHDRQ